MHFAASRKSFCFNLMQILLLVFACKKKDNLFIINDLYALLQRPPGWGEGLCFLSNRFRGSANRATASNAFEPPLESIDYELPNL